MEISLQMYLYIFNQNYLIFINLSKLFNIH